MDSISLECLICFETPKLAVETECCGQCFCQTCIQPIKVCPYCRKEDVKFYANKGLRRLLNDKTPCPNRCGEMLKLPDMFAHLRVCNRPNRTCPAPGCTSVGFQNDKLFLTHLTNDHTSDLLVNARLLFHRSTTAAVQTDAFAVPLCLRDGYCPTEPQMNAEGRRARLGVNGKFYCGLQTKMCKAAHPYHCDCECCQTTANCGPANGCNCDPCQKLDLNMHGITEKGWLVATDGTLAKFQPSPKGKHYYDGLFVCGRRRLEHAKDNLDLYCGYTPQKACNVCKRLLEHVRAGQYKQFLENK